MKAINILAIETSCDETAISIIETKGGIKNTKIKVLSNVVLSQVELHAEYGGVFPTLAKREHAKNLIPVLEDSLKKAGLYKKSKSKEISINNEKTLKALFEREPGLLEHFMASISQLDTPKIDMIVVTHGPGLEPALWVGINFAKALSLVWDKPLIPANHMEGHIFSGLLEKQGSKEYTPTPKRVGAPTASVGEIMSYELKNIKFPALALLISGGHTELVLIKDWLKYKIVGQTKDDASGEAFDKVARMLSLPYPGGPEISKLASKFKSSEKGLVKNWGVKLPRPMIGSPDFDFSFSGLKTSVLYLIQNLEKQNIKLDEKLTAEIAYEFEKAVTDVLIKKTIKASEKFKVKTIILGGGVSANKKIRREITKKINSDLPDTKLFLPDPKFTGDNALMIAIAGLFKYLKNPKRIYKNIKADGNLRLS